MNLFRSEEHARRWEEFDAALEATLLPMDDWATIFSTPIFRERVRPDYISWLQGEAGRAGMRELRETLPT
jgi:hypothetical protein